VIRVPEKVDDLGPNNLCLRPEDIRYHEQRLLRYKVDIEILEINS